MRGSLVNTVRFSGAGLFFAGAAVLAILAGFSVYAYLRAAVPNRTVWVVSRDLPPGSALSAADLEARTVPAVTAPEDAVPDQDALAGRRLRFGLVKGDLLREAHLVKKDSIDLGRVVDERGPNYRAVMLPGELVPGLDRLMPGDRLELTGVLPVQDQRANSFIAVSLGEATVLEVHKAQGQRENSSVLVTMEAAEVSRLALAMRAGSLTVAIEGQGQVKPAPSIRLEGLTGTVAPAQVSQSTR